jgi:hypothetical protein
MQRTLDEATSRFLETARADLQRQLGSVGMVEAVTIERLEPEVWLSARVRLGGRQVLFSGAGDNLVAAYGALTRSGAAPGLRSPQRMKR